VNQTPVWVYTGENLDARDGSRRRQDIAADKEIDDEEQVWNSVDRARVRFRGKRFRSGRGTAAMGLWI
jgi:hypothetical protein